MKEFTPRILLDGFSFGEGPRWYKGKLWFSDMYNNRVMTVDLKGRSEVIVTVPQRPSGIGFLPDGRPLIVSMLDRKLLRLDRDGLKLHSDISHLCGGDANDMVVDAQGRAYIGNLGFDTHRGEEFRPAQLILVTPDDKARAAADGLKLPNGTVITPDGKTLIVAESRGGCLTAFSIGPDGSLSNRRTFANLGDVVPDGISLDAQGGIWVGLPRSSEFIRVLEGGTITHRISTPGKMAVACMLGGEDRRTLFLLTAKATIEEIRKGISQGFVEIVQVDVPGAGWP